MLPMMFSWFGYNKMGKYFQSIDEQHAVDHFETIPHWYGRYLQALTCTYHL